MSSSSPHRFALCNLHLVTLESSCPHSLGRAADAGSLEMSHVATARGEVGAIGQAPERNHDVESTPPPELLDHIVNLLQDANYTLRNCSLVSKSWVPRARKHLFADIRFRIKEDPASWKETFPDPSTSPSRYAKTLNVSYPDAVTAADAEVGGWIRGFSRVAHLGIDDQGLSSWQLALSLVPFHGLSPTIKSLRVAFNTVSSSRMFGLVLSFPLLEDLTAVAYFETVGDDFNGVSTSVQPSRPPTFTGTLGLFLKEGMGPIVRRLLSLQGGLHFRKLELMLSCEEDVSLAVAVVEGCSHTFESLDIACDLISTSIQFPRPHPRLTPVTSRVGANFD